MYYSVIEFLTIKTYIMNIKKEKMMKVKGSIDNYISTGEYVSALDLIRRYKVDGYTITMTRAVHEYKVEREELLNLPHHVVANPHFSSSHPMRLFLTSQLNELFEYRNRCAA